MITILATAREALPVFDSVTVCAILVLPTFWFVNVMLLVDKLAVGLTPVPDKFTICGLPLPLSAIVSVPVRLPVAVGENVTLIAQLAPTTKLLPQVLVSTKSPLAVTLATAMSEAPVFVNVTDCGALVLPTSWPLKVSALAERLAMGPPAPGVTDIAEPGVGE